jgi:hypothetical protein
MNGKLKVGGKEWTIGKYSFVNRTMQHWNQLPAGVSETLPCKQTTFKKRVRKVITEMS